MDGKRYGLEMIIAIFNFFKNDGYRSWAAALMTLLRKPNVSLLRSLLSISPVHTILPLRRLEGSHISP